MPDQIDFKKLATDIDITDVAAHLGITLGKDHRAACPGCDGDHDRNLEILTETNSFRCYTGTPRPGRKYLAGDCIALYAHVRGYTGQYRAAKELQEHFFGTATAAHKPATPPQKPEGRTEHSQPAPFNPDAFAAKLQYTGEVEALGISEDDAKRVLIGWHPQRKAIYIGFRNPDGSVSGFIKFDDGELTMPPRWIAGNVVPMKRRA